MLVAMLRQAQKELAKTDVFTFGEYVFGYEAAPHHRQMVEFMNERIERHENGVILAPRGAAKTQWPNTINLSHRIARTPDIRVGLFSQKDKKAEAMSAAIQWTLSESENFKEIFGDLRGPAKWTATEWLRKDSPWAASKDRTMIAGGANSSSGVSKRFDLLLLDDILDENNTYTIDQREKIETWFWKSLKPTLVPGGSIIVLGTRWVEGDLYEKLIESNKWPALIIDAIQEDEDGNEKSYWPSVWPLERLYKEREDVGWDNFACSYRNDISGLREGTIFKKEWFDHFEELPRNRRYVFTIGVDLATSERQRADYTTRVLVAEDEFHEHWVLSSTRTKIETGHKEFVKAGYEAARQAGYYVSRIIIENNQHQSTLIQDLIAETSMPVVGKRTEVDKRQRARGVAARYEARRVHHHQSLRGGELEAEMLNFPKGHDDQIDALGLAMDIIGVTGAMAVASTGSRPAPEAPPVPTGKTVDFVTGPREVPAYVAEMLAGIDTARWTYEEAMKQADSRNLNNFINSQIAGVLRG
jgi:phage terminase large subunit-like protein